MGFSTTFPSWSRLPRFPLVGSVAIWRWLVSRLHLHCDSIVGTCFQGAHDPGQLGQYLMYTIHLCASAAELTPRYLMLSFTY